MNFKQFFENEQELIIDPDAKVLNDLKDIEIVNAGAGSNIVRHNAIEQSEKYYVDELTQYFIKLYEKLKEKFIKLVNSEFVINLLQKLGIQKKIEKISEVVVLFLKSNRFAKYLTSKFSKLDNIRQRHKERDEFLRKEVIGNEMLFV